MKLTKIFTFLKENNLLVFAKEKLIEVVDKNKDELKPKINEYIQEKSPKVKDFLLNTLIKKIKFGFPMCMFKGLVKKTISKNFDKVVEFILTQVNK